MSVLGGFSAVGFVCVCAAVPMKLAPEVHLLALPMNKVGLGLGPCDLNLAGCQLGVNVAFTQGDVCWCVGVDLCLKMWQGKVVQL